MAATNTTAVKIKVQNAVDIEYLIGHLKHEDIHLYEALLKLRRLYFEVDVPGTSFTTGAISSYEIDLNAEKGRFRFKNIVHSGEVDSIHVIGLYVDETTVENYYGILSQDMSGVTDPVTLNVSVVSKDNEVLLKFSVGDYVILDDPLQDTNDTNFRKYEILKLTNKSGAAYTFARGQFGSNKSSHLAGVRFYPLRMGYFSTPYRGPSLARKEAAFDLSVATLVATSAAPSSAGGLGTFVTVNVSRVAYPHLSAPPELYNHTMLNPAPGFRTCDGASFLIQLDGVLIAGQTLPEWLVVENDFSLRYAVGKMEVPPVGNVAVYDGILASMTNVSLVGYVLYAEPLQKDMTELDRRVAVMEQFAVRENEFWTFQASDILDKRRMPYVAKWPFALPVVGTIGSLFDTTIGELRTNVLPFVATGEYIYSREGGGLNACVARIGSTYAGKGLGIGVAS